MTSSTQKDFGLSEDAIRKLTEDEVKRIQAFLSFVNAPNYLERAFKNYGIVTDSEKKQCFAEYNISSPFDYNIRCNIESFGGFSDPKVTWDDFKSMVKEEYKAFDLANTYAFLFYRASIIAASSITSFIDLDLRIEAFIKQLAKLLTKALQIPESMLLVYALIRTSFLFQRGGLDLKVTFVELIEIDKPELAYTAILNRNASRSEDLRNLPVILLKAFKAALKLKAKPFKTVKSYERLGKVISFLRIDYEATRIKLLKGRDLPRNLTLDKTIAFFAAPSTFKRSFSESAKVSVITYDAAVKFEVFIAYDQEIGLRTIIGSLSRFIGYADNMSINIEDLAKVFGMYKTKDKKIKPIDEADGVKAALSGKVREYKQYFFPRIADIPKGSRITLERIANLDVGNTLRLKERDLFKKMMLSKEKSIAFA
ncbi:hypothetical protein MBM_03180 [Drepanopeziza brunnea f. sp. 'multigermtubi' MB_m1]|uniref:Uncharacterized protein n=1 Tax=Marssonina brunnea f. sp. multigermtubi (strain MB_m1) TaxID=1072389 RepID=K1XDI8_MARBU|nr:uncharacterized protein MBM_03180 [Drepanopeziza brunnea f. sp. 'multigermtubi' MB_m1]EKD18938.1 hypothetical protein MBM_03180 [Drepanopeziza brunnea f. sp. 'multigermtubi' MB_m1]